MLALAVPVGVYLAGIYWLYNKLLGDIDPFHALLMVVTALVLVSGPLLAAAGVSMAVCLLVVMLAPAVTVIGYEMRGHRHIADALERTLQQ